MAFDFEDLKYDDSVVRLDWGVSYDGRFDSGVSHDGRLDWVVSYDGRLDWVVSYDVRLDWGVSYDVRFDWGVFIRWEIGLRGVIRGCWWEILTGWCHLLTETKGWSPQELWVWWTGRNGQEKTEIEIDGRKVSVFFIMFLFSWLGVGMELTCFLTMPRRERVARQLFFWKFGNGKEKVRFDFLNEAETGSTELVLFFSQICCSPSHLTVHEGA